MTWRRIQSDVLRYLLTLGLIVVLAGFIGCSDDPSSPDDDNDDNSGTECTPVAAMRLTENAAWDEDAAWSPDGSKIAFESDRVGSYNIWIMDADGGELRQLSIEGGSNPSWSPDGEWITFNSGRSGTSQIYKISSSADPPGSGPDNATQFTDVTDEARGPNWVGEYIYFWINIWGSEPEQKLWRIKGSDGSGLEQMWDHQDEVHSPSFSQDGTKVSYYGNMEDQTTNSYIYVANAADLSGRVKLTNVSGEVEDRYPSWSWDGNHIVFSRWREGMDELDIFKMPVTGESTSDPATRLTWNQTGSEKYAVWSPDDSKITFTGERNENADIYVMPACGEPEP